jgi:hypothetical protein
VNQNGSRPVLGKDRHKTEQNRTNRMSDMEECELMEKYDILVYENNCMYDTRHANAANVLEVFLKMCKDYVNPEYTGQDSVHLDSSKRFVSYADRSGNDKAMLVVLIGTITDEILEGIRDGLQNLYDRR